MSLITVLVADDEPSVGEALKEMIDAHPLLEVVALASDADEAIDRAVESSPDVALIDVKMPGGGGARAARGIVEHSPRTRIVAFSAYDDRAIVRVMLRSGATSYVVKGAGAEEVIDAILRSARGESVLSPAIAGGVVEELASHLEATGIEQDGLDELAGRVQEVIDGELFEIVFQPIVDLTDGQTVGAEALSRFPALPIQSPDHWFADAGRVGLRAQLELATARKALAQLDETDTAMFFAINFTPETLPLCCELLHDWGPRLVIEITEHSAIEDYEEIRPLLSVLARDGVRLAVDDAGAGFASLRHALQLAPAFIKLDISLTRGIEHDRSRTALATGLIGFAAELGAEIVAEGIETRGALDTLRELGVRYGQGYLLAKPAPLPLGIPHLRIIEHMR